MFLTKRQQTHEFLKQNWSKKDCEKRAPSLLFSIQFFNERSRWFSTCILKETSTKSRALIIEKFIEVAHEFTKLQNFNGALEVAACLFSSHIARLKNSWNKISSQHSKMYLELEQLLNTTGNYKDYREKLKESQSPCLPYMGLMLTDLTFIDDSNNDQTEKLINVDKVALLGNSISCLVTWLENPYPFEPDETVQNFLMKDEPWAEQDFYEISKIRENEQTPKKDHVQAHIFNTVSGKAELDMTTEFSEQDEKILLSAASTVDFKTNSTILGSAFDSNGFFRIKKGSVHVLKNGKQKVHVLRPGDWFGEFSVLTNSDQNAYKAGIVYLTWLIFLTPVQLFKNHSQKPRIAPWTL